MVPNTSAPEMTGAETGQMPMGAMPPIDNGGSDFTEGDGAMAGPVDGMSMGNSAQGGDPTVDSENQFDTNFDAGVEADEDADPKKYIQQLTGKLSQKLNSYNGENSDDELSKYVGKMIIKQVAKGLDDESKKELIKTLKSTPSDDEEITNDESLENDGETTDDTMNPDTQEVAPMHECRFTKAELKGLFEGFTMGGDGEDNRQKEPNNKMKSSDVFRGKKY